MREYSTKQFLYIKKQRIFVADLSDLGPNAGEFYLKSHRTGARKLFTYTGQDLDKDGDIAGWRYASDDLCALIIND